MPISLPTIQAGKGGGDSDLAIIGTGTSHPAGLEAVYEYNGLVLNDRSLIDTFVFTSIDGFADADIRDQREVNPNYHGETAFNAFYGGRTIAIQGRIRAHEIRKLRDMQEALKLAFGSLNEIPLRIISNFANFPIEINCRKLQSIGMAEIQQNRTFTRDFLLTLRASDPRFRSLIEFVYEFDSDGSTFDPLILLNQGNHPAQPRLSLTGPITNATITNTANGQTMTFIGTLASGNTININILRRTIVDDAGDSAFGSLDIDSDWLELDPGDNEIDISGTGLSGVTAATIAYKHTWL